MTVLDLAASSTKSKGSPLGTLIPLLLIVVVGYLLFIRPARARQRKAAETRGSVAPGAEVITTAGMIATVVDVDDDTVTLEVAPGVHSRFVKGAIARVTTPVEPVPDTPEVEPETPDEPSSGVASS